MKSKLRWHYPSAAGSSFSGGVLLQRHRHPSAVALSSRGRGILLPWRYPLEAKASFSGEVILQRQTHTSEAAPYLRWWRYPTKSGSSANSTCNKRFFTPRTAFVRSESSAFFQNSEILRMDSISLTFPPFSNSYIFS